MMVYVAVIDHEYGVDITVHKSRVSAGKTLIKRMQSLHDELDDELDGHNYKKKLKKLFKEFDDACQEEDVEKAISLYNEIYAYFEDGPWASLRASKLDD